MSTILDEMFAPELMRDAWYLNGVTPLSDYTTMDTLSGTNHAPKSYVYFIQSGDFIKIGCSANPEERVAQLRRGGKALRPTVWEGNPSLIGYVPGTKADERALHANFNHLHDRGEWFRVSPELTEFALGARQEQVRIEVAVSESRRRDLCKTRGIEVTTVDLDQITAARIDRIASDAQRLQGRGQL